VQIHAEERFERYITGVPLPIHGIRSGITCLGSQPMANARPGHRRRSRRALADEARFLQTLLRRSDISSCELDRTTFHRCAGNRNRPCLFFLSYDIFVLKSHQVSIAQKDFNLTLEQEAIDFFREMCNLTKLIQDLADDLDPTKESALKEFARTARPVTSFTAPQTEQPKSLRSIPTVAEGDDARGGTQGGLQEDVFSDPDLQSLLAKMGFEIDGVIFGVCVSKT
jgi:hypothetical protein